jgi:beta-glucosidase/6-phospho-beta-glucosidase/beta-galactosidase
MKFSALAFLFFLSALALGSETWPLDNAYFQNNLSHWATQKNIELESRMIVSDTVDVTTLTPQEAYVRFNLPEKINLNAAPLPPPKDSSITEIKSTVDAYFNNFGKNNIKSFLWSGVETGNTLTTKMDYRWNSLKEAGMYDPQIRKQFIAGLKKIGITNLRFGFSNHEIKRIAPGVWDDSSWDEATAMINDFVDHGIDLSLDLNHFGLESQFCVDASLNPVTYWQDGVELCHADLHDPSKSFLLHEQWPDYFADFALEAFKRFFPKVKAYTIINEPETVKGFNSGLWYGAFPGWNNSIPTGAYFEAKRSIKVGIAAVKARLKIEQHLKSMKTTQRPVFLHVEAMVPKMHWSDFNQHIRYMTSDTILGHSWVMENDFTKMKKTPVTELMRSIYWNTMPEENRTVFNLLAAQTIYWGFDGNVATQEQRKNEFLTSLEYLQSLHKTLQINFNQSMKSYTVLGVDYYSHNEEGLTPKPELYNQQIKDGKRIGLFATAKDYFNRYHMPMMITETGTPYFVYGARWHQQMLLEAAKLQNAGIPLLAYTIYPAIDTYGWEHAISRPKEPLYRAEGSLYNPSGIFYLTAEPPKESEVFGWEPMAPKPFIFELLKHLSNLR